MHTTASTNEIATIRLKKITGMFFKRRMARRSSAIARMKAAIKPDQRGRQHRKFFGRRLIGLDTRVVFETNIIFVTSINALAIDL